MICVQSLHVTVSRISTLTTMSDASSNLPCYITAFRGWVAISFLNDQCTALVGSGMHVCVRELPQSVSNHWTTKARDSVYYLILQKQTLTCWLSVCHQDIKHTPCVLAQQPYHLLLICRIIWTLLLCRTMLDSYDHIVNLDPHSISTVGWCHA